LQVLPGQQDSFRIKTLIKLSQAYFSIHEDSAMYYALLLKKETEKSAYMDRMSDAYMIVGTCFRHASDMDSALFYKHLALAAAEKSGYQKGVANACSDIGLYEKEIGQFDSAIIYSVRAVEIRERLNDKKTLGTSYINLGLLFYDSKEADKAMYYYRKAAECFESTSIKNYALALNDIAAIYDDKKQYDSALVIYKRSLTIRDSIGDRQGVSQVMLNMGVLYRDMNDFVNSEKFLESALELKKSLGGEEETMAICMLDLSETYRVTKKYPQAEGLLNTAFPIAKANQLKELERDICLEYSKVYSDEKKYDLALQFMNLYVEKKDSILDEERLKSLNDLQTKYETVRKEKENAKLTEEGKEKELKIEQGKTQTVYLYAGLGVLLLILAFSFYAYRVKTKSNHLLTEKNDQINRHNKTLKELNLKLIESEEELTVLNKTKDKLFSVISHDISNPVKAIANYNQAILAREGELNREQLAEALRKVNASVQPLQGFIDNLLHWSLLQRNGASSRPEKFNAIEIVNEIISLYMPYAQQKKIALVPDVSSSMRLSADKNMFRLVLRNLVSNAIKYSNEGAKVVISARTTGDKILVKVKDEGNGIDTRKIREILDGKQVSSEKGTFAETGTGLGLTLVTEFLKMNESALQIESNPGNGTSFSFELISA
jgi:two-component system sensor histidine kinase/response regulator